MAEYGFIYPTNSWLDGLTRGVGRTQEFYEAGGGGGTGRERVLSTFWELNLHFSLIKP